MSNNLQVFESPEFGAHRFIIINGELWIAGVDVCNVLEYTNPSKAIRDHVDDEDKRTLTREEFLTVTNRSCQTSNEDFLTPPNQGSRKTRGGAQSMTFINISGFFSLVLSSKLPGAKRYRHWVTSEVLPSIHEKGFYSVAKPDSYMIEDKVERAKRWIEEEEERQRLIEENRELKPKASYCDAILKCTNLVTTTVIAKDYGKSAVWLNAFLCEHGVQYYATGQKVWVLKSKYANKGYAKTDSFPVAGKYGQDKAQLLLKWTQQGRMFLYEFLKAQGILPLMETQ